MATRRLVVLLHIVAFGPALLAQRTAPLPPSRADRANVVPLIGRWRLNLARTRYGPSVDARRRETFACDEITGGRVRCVIQSVRRDGREILGRFVAPVDGSPGPVIGVEGVDTVQLRQREESILDATFSFQGKPAFAYRAYRSSDGRSLIILSVDPVSRVALTSVVVYDRQ